MYVRKLKSSSLLQKYLLPIKTLSLLLVVETDCPTIHTRKVDTVLTTKLTPIQVLLNTEIRSLASGKGQLPSPLEHRIFMKNTLYTRSSVVNRTFSLSVVIASLWDNQYVPEPDGFLSYTVHAG